MPDLPLPRPIARGAGVCHILALHEGEAAKQWGTMAALCGIACGSFCGDANYEDGMTECPVHDDELCAECLEIVADPLWRAGVRDEP